MTTTTTVGAMTNPNATGSDQGGGFGRYLMFALILVAVFFTAKALTTDNSVSPPASDTPAVVQPDTDAPK